LLQNTCSLINVPFTITHVFQRCQSSVIIHHRNYFGHQFIKMFNQLGPNSYSGRQFVTKFSAT